MAYQQHQQGVTPNREPFPENNVGQSFLGTDIATSNENLSSEQRFVLRNYSRVEPQGQENLIELLATSKTSPPTKPSTS